MTAPTGEPRTPSNEASLNKPCIFSTFAANGVTFSAFSHSLYSFNASTKPFTYSGTFMFSVLTIRSTSFFSFWIIGRSSVRFFRSTFAINSSSSRSKYFPASIYLWISLSNLVSHDASTNTLRLNL